MGIFQFGRDPGPAGRSPNVAQDSSMAKTKLPAIPDLRFEYSYLKNVQPFVKIKRVGRRVQEHHEGEGEVVDDDSPREIIEIEWRRVLWVTLRDQVIHPLLQGTLWCVVVSNFLAYRFKFIAHRGFASVYLKPLSARLGFGSTKSIVQGPRKDGEGVSWLRQKLGFRRNARPPQLTT